MFAILTDGYIADWNAVALSSGSATTLPTHVLWMLLSAVDCGTIVDFAFLDRFLSEDVAGQISAVHLAQIARDFFSNVMPVTSPFSDFERKAGLRSLIIPALQQRLERGVRMV